MFKNNHMEPNKITLVGWVDHVLKQSFTKKNMKSKFKAIYIYNFLTLR